MKYKTRILKIAKTKIKEKISEKIEMLKR